MWLHLIPVGDVQRHAAVGREAREAPLTRRVSEGLVRITAEGDRRLGGTKSDGKQSGFQALHFLVR